jgi:predicted PurR-regulated permease PerM
LQRVVGGYIRGQAITSGAIFFFTFVMLEALRVPNALAIAAIAAVADLIPLVGVYILLTPIVVVTLSKSITTMVIAVGLSLLYQQFEDRVLTPRVYGATLRLPTIAVVLSILIGAELMGLVGALVALPVAAAIRVVIEYFADVRHQGAEAAAVESGTTDQVFAPQMPGDEAAERAAHATEAGAAR